ncbi:hypothetical protein CCR75_009680 [Bremia lactucae]|uniref:Uncharacterized protein n=1 Tax=Bremia lactucae TaxID=4779 RepID=A0A976P048_BRELC|nr:hypothetical protein CCR75_009680 [Bremia lactucae]
MLFISSSSHRLSADQQSIGGAVSSDEERQFHVPISLLTLLSRLPILARLLSADCLALLDPWDEFINIHRISLYVVLTESLPQSRKAESVWLNDADRAL